MLREFQTISIDGVLATVVMIHNAHAFEIEFHDERERRVVTLDLHPEKTAALKAAEKDELRRRYPDVGDETLERLRDGEELERLYAEAERKQGKSGASGEDQ